MESEIIQFIEQILQRDPEPGEVDSWMALMNTNPNLDLDGVRDRIIDSAEAMDTVYPVIRAYQAVYGRVPDAGGLDFWTDVYRELKDHDDASTPTVNEGMVELLKPFVDPVQTEEFADRFGTNPNGNQFVSACYTNVLNRSPDQGGQAYWEGVYNQVHDQYEAENPGLDAAQINIMTRALILEQFVNSVEYQASADPFIDTFLEGAADETESYSGDLWDRAPYSLSVADTTVVEGDNGEKVVTLGLVLDKAADEDVTFTWSTGGGDATPGDDYVPQNGTVTIKAGETSAHVTIPVLGDTVPELNETFDVTFSSPLITSGSATSTVTIFDDESTVTPLTTGIDILTGGPSDEVFLSGDDELGSNDRIDGGAGEDTLYHMVNRASDFAENASWMQRFSIADDLSGDAGENLAQGTGVVWSGFQTENVEVLAIQNNDEWFYGNGEAHAQYSDYGHTEFGYGLYEGEGYYFEDGGAALVDVQGMDGLQTVVFYQQNGVTGVRDLQASQIAHDGVHVALIDVEGFHGQDGDSYGPNSYQILEQDNPWTCSDEGGLPRQIASTVDTIIDFDRQATVGENSINVLLNEVAVGNLWFTQNLDNRDGELAEIEQLNLSLPGETELPGSEFDGIAGEPALINRIWASSTLETITVTGDDVTELANGGEADDQYDLMLGIPILATTENWEGSGADTGSPWGLDVGLPGLTTFDASEFNGDLLLTLYNAVDMTITGGAGDDDFFINADDGEMGNLGWYTDDNGLLQNTDIDGGEGFNTLWLPMSEADGEPNSPNNEFGFDAVGPGNTLTNIDEIRFYGAIGEGSTFWQEYEGGSGSSFSEPVPAVHELNMDYLGLADPGRTELIFDGSIGATTVIFDNFGDTIVDDAQIINVKFTDLGGWIGDTEIAVREIGIQQEGDDPIYAPTLAFVPDAGVDPLDQVEDIVNVAFADDTRASTFVTITDDEHNGDDPSEWDGDDTGAVDQEVDVLNIHLEDSDCGVANCLHVGIDSMVGLEEINVTDDDFERNVTPAMAAFFTYLAEIADEGWEPGDSIWNYDVDVPAGLSEDDAEYFEKLFGLNWFDHMNGNGVPLPANYADLNAGDTFVVEQSFAIGSVNGDHNDTPNLQLFDAGDSSANIDMWLNGSDGGYAPGYADGIGQDLYQLDFYVDPETHEGATIITGSGNDRVIDGAGNDTISTGAGCDLVMAINGGDDEINAGSGNDLIVGGDGSDVIDGGAGDDMISGDSFGWLLSLLNEECHDIDVTTANQFLEFFQCIESECFKDDFNIDWDDLGDLSSMENLVSLLNGPMHSLGLLDALVPGTSATLANVLSNISDYVDNVQADFGNDLIHGNDGNDIIHGGSGNDKLYGDDGQDIVVGGDDNDLVDGGANADIMIGGGNPVQPGIDAVIASAVISATGLHGEGDQYSVTVNGHVYNATLDVGESINDVMTDLANQIDANTATNGVGGAGFADGKITITGNADGSDIVVSAGATDGAVDDLPVAEVSSVTIDDSMVYDLGDVIRISIDTSLSDAAPAVNYDYAARDGDTAAIIAQELADLINAGSQMTATVNNGEITLTGDNPSNDYTINAGYASGTIAPTITTYEVDLTGLDQAGESMTVVLDQGGGLWFPEAFAFSQNFNTDFETTLNDFVTTHKADMLDILDDGVDNGTDGATTGDDIYIIDDQLFIHDEGDTLGYYGLVGDDTVRASINGTGSATILIDEGHNNATPTVDDNAPTHVDDNTQGLIVAENNPGTPAIPAGTDGSDIFVAQTDGVLGDSWYSHAQGGEHTVNQLDSILDFWSSQSPAVNDSADPDYQQVRDYLGFRDADGNVVTFSGNFYEEQHNNANTYEDALANANAAMANGVTRVVAISYNEGVEDNCDTVFDQNENFLVVFADTDNDNLADTAVRLVGRDNVLDDFHSQDVTSLFS